MTKKKKKRKQSQIIFLLGQLSAASNNECILQKLVPRLCLKSICGSFIITHITMFA